MCDEPLSNLDADLRERMRVEISSLVRESGATAIYITRDQAEAFALADQIGLLLALEPAGPVLRSCLARVSGGHVPAGDAVLLIRPTALALTGPDSGEHHLAGTVADVAFRGRGYEHAIDIPGHGRLTGIFAPTRSDRGQAVGLKLDPAGCYLFPVEVSSAISAHVSDAAAEPHRESPGTIQGAGLLGLDRV